MLALCFIVTVFEGYDLQSMGVAAPLLGKAMGLDKAQMSAALTAAMLGLMGGAASGGWLGDRLSRTMVLAIAAGCSGSARWPPLFPGTCHRWSRFVP